MNPEIKAFPGVNPGPRGLALWLALLGALFCAGCASVRHAPRDQLPEAPQRPQAGEPINCRASLLYLYREATNLVQQGKLTPSRLQKVDFKTCALKLAPCSERTLTPAELHETVEMGVAVVARVFRCDRCKGLHLEAGTGFFLTESGALATCLHLVGDRSLVGMAVMTRDGRVCPVRQVLAADVTNDVVILQVGGEGFTPLPVAAGARPGSPVFVVSHPQLQFYLLSSGIVSGYHKETAKHGEASWMSITADFAKGSSGAPVFNQCGAVVGIANRTYTMYAQDHNKEPPNWQMVEKICTPSAALLNLIRQP